MRLTIPRCRQYGVDTDGGRKLREGDYGELTSGWGAQVGGEIWQSTEATSPGEKVYLGA